MRLVNQVSSTLNKPKFKFFTEVCLQTESYLQTKVCLPTESYLQTQVCLQTDVC